jgi:hypothetical protein
MTEVRIRYLVLQMGFKNQLKKYKSSIFIRIPKIPADDYDKQTAEEVLNLTRLILEYASDRI